jgi:D-sedoheptulose 7-phosphate isomerase
LVFSVGGGNLERNISPNLVGAVQLAQQVGAKVLGVVGKKDGYTAQVGDVVVVIPIVRESLITPYSEGFQAVVWHSLVSHPALQASPTKW